MVVGWYHSHPGFGCWLSGVDINTQQSFEALSERAVAVVVDPIQSVKGKVCVCVCIKLYLLHAKQDRFTTVSYVFRAICSFPNLADMHPGLDGFNLNKDQLSLTNLHNALHHGECAANI